MSEKSKTLIPLTCWMDIPGDNDFPDEMYYAAYKGESGWIMRGPFIQKERAEESLMYFRHFRCRLYTFKVSEMEELIKTRRPAGGRKA